MADVNDALSRALNELIAERDRLNEAISAVERAMGAPARRGRKPGRPAGSGEVKVKVKRNWSPAARKAAAERMRKYWAEWRQEKATKRGGRRKASSGAGSQGG